MANNQAIGSSLPFWATGTQPSTSDAVFHISNPSGSDSLGTSSISATETLMANNQAIGSSLPFWATGTQPSTSDAVFHFYDSNFSFSNGTDLASLSKSISDIAANGQLIIGWTIIYRTTETQ
jgi:hypothetical protein